MNKILSATMSVLMVLSFSACTPSSVKETPDYNTMVSSEVNDLNLFVDGADVTDGNIHFEDIKENFSVVTLNDVNYYAASLQDICSYDLSTVKAFFGEAIDGFIRYYNDLENAYIAVLESESGENFVQIDCDGVAGYALVLPKDNIVKGIKNIYMLTKPVDFEVSIQENGKEKGKLTISEFMKKTKVGDQKVLTSMFNGSFKYNFGESTYKATFLGINYDTMLAKLADSDMTIEGKIKEVEYYGTPGMGKPGKNMAYTLYSDEDSYFGNVSFFCMYDGMTNNPNIKDIDLGLSVFVNGSGQKWLTYNLTKINFITE